MSTVDDLLTAARRVAGARIAPLARELDEVGWVESVWADLCELGVPGLCLPTEYGGLGLPYSAYLAVTAEISRASAVAGLMPALNVLVGRALVRSATPDVRDRYLPGLASGAQKACWAFTEPATGPTRKRSPRPRPRHPAAGGRSREARRSSRTRAPRISRSSSPDSTAG